MARIRRRGGSWQPRDAQCPRRQVGLTHVQDGSADCVFCGALTYRREAGEVEAEDFYGDVSDGDATLSVGEVERRLEGAQHVSSFTQEQTANLMFLRWLRENGRV